VPWTVAVTKPNHEAIAAVNLQRQGFIYYYPRFLKQLKPGIAPTARPLFPRYVFVFTERLWRSLSGTRGISYILMGEGGPQILPDSVVNSLKARENDKGFYQLVAPPKFTPGCKVKAEAGPLSGLPLIYEGMTAQDRAKVLVEILGRFVPATLEEKLLVAA
jgi:transcription antitermination factor NusG